LYKVTTRAAASIFACIASIAISAPANAQAFDIPAGNLQVSLDRFARTSGVQLLYRVEDVRNLRTPGAKGTTTPQATLRALLKGTGLVATTDPSGAMAVVRGTQSQLTVSTGRQLASAISIAPSSQNDSLGPDTPAPIFAEGDDASVTDIVVTATKRTERLQDVPLSVAAFSGEVIDRLGVEQAGDLAAQTPGFNVQGPYTSAKPQFSIRGIVNNAVNANGVPAVGVYIDEVYLNSPITQGLPTYDLERVEVLRGPQGTLFGANTTGGAISFVSRRPDPADGFNGFIEAGLGNYGLRNVAGAIGLPIGDTAAIRLSGYYDDVDGYRRNTLTGSRQNFHETLALRGQISWEVTPDLKARFSFNYHKTDADIAYEQQGAQDPVTFAPCSSSSVLADRCIDFFGYSEKAVNDDFYSALSIIDSMDRTEVKGGALTIDWTLPFATLTSISALYHNEYDSFEDLSMSPFDNALLQYQSSGRQITQELRLTSAAQGPLKWIVGLYYLSEDSQEFEVVHGYSLAGFFGGARAAAFKTYDLDTKDYAAFADGSYEIVPGLTLRAGLRYTRETKEMDFYRAYSLTPGISASPVGQDFINNNLLFAEVDVSRNAKWSEFSGRASLDYKISDDVMVYGSYARGFRGGNFNMTSQSNGEVVDPEFVDTIEAGLKSQLLDRLLRFNLSGYYSKYDDQQVTTVRGAAVILSNAASSTIYGLEAELQATPMTGLLLSAGTSLMHAEFDEFIDSQGIDRSGNRLENTPSTTFNALARYEYPETTRGTFAVQVDTSYKSGHFLDLSNKPESRQDAYWLLNSRLEFIANNGFELALWAKNITGTKYYVNWFDGVNFTGGNMYSTGRPTTYGITGKFKW